MKTQIEYLRATRNNYLKFIEGLSIDQLNKIPEGFNNNIIWNFGHALITQQLLQYKLGGVQPLIEEELLNKYRKGAKPTSNVSQEEVEFLKSQMLSSIDQLESDYAAGKFKSYSEYTTSYGSTLRSIEDAITFNTIHEGLHLGVIMALKKLV